MLAPQAAALRQELGTWKTELSTWKQELSGWKEERQQIRRHSSALAARVETLTREVAASEDALQSAQRQHETTARALRSDKVRRGQDHCACVRAAQQPHATATA